MPDHLAVPREVVEKAFGNTKYFLLASNNYVRYEDYFCDDVMLMNPKFFREHFEDILNACKFIYDNGYICLEQDALIYLFSKKYKKLPFKFNLAPYWARKVSFPIEQVIYHFGGEKPNLNTDDVFNRLYFEYFLKTPWANADMFGNIDKAVVKTVGQIFNESKNILLHVTNLLGSRRRAFFVDRGFLEPAKQIFAINADELVIDLSTEAETLIGAMNANKGKLLLFILAGNYPQIRDFLTGQNFVEGIDFINGFLFLSERHGFKMNFDTRSIIKEM